MGLSMGQGQQGWQPLHKLPNMGMEDASYMASVTPEGQVGAWAKPVPAVGTRVNFRRFHVGILEGRANLVGRRVPCCTPSVRKAVGDAAFDCAHCPGVQETAPGPMSSWSAQVHRRPPFTGGLGCHDTAMAAVLMLIPCGAYRGQRAGASGSTRNPDNHAKLIVEGVLPHLLHAVPVLHDTVLDRGLDDEDTVTTPLLGLLAEKVLVGSDYPAVANNRGNVLSGATSLSAPIVDDNSWLLAVTMFLEKLYDPHSRKLHPATGNPWTQNPVDKLPVGIQVTQLL